MKCLERNKVRFFYSLYQGKEAITDDDGNVTGEYELKYGNPIEYYANISAAKGETQTRQFGENESYDKVIVMDNTAPPIDEYSVLWVDSAPSLDESGKLVLNEQGEIETPHDYIVRKVAKSLNVVSLAICKVNVS